MEILHSVQRFNDSKQLVQAEKNKQKSSKKEYACRCIAALRGNSLTLTQRSCCTPAKQQQMAWHKSVVGAYANNFHWPQSSRYIKSHLPHPLWQLSQTHMNHSQRGCSDQTLACGRNVENVCWLHRGMSDMIWSSEMKTFPKQEYNNAIERRAEGCWFF